MFRLNWNRDRIIIQAGSQRLKTSLVRALKASESPMGFAIIAATAFAVVFLLHMIGTDNPATATNGLAEENTQGAALASEPATASRGDALELAANAVPQPGKRAPTAASDMAHKAPQDVASETKHAEKSYRLRRNETLIRLMRRAGISNGEAHKAVAALGKVTNLRKLQRGQEVRIVAPKGKNTPLHRLTLRDTFDEQAVVLRTERAYRAERQQIATMAVTHLVEGEITDSLYLSAQRAGLPTKVIVDLIRLMSFDVDFEREIRVGDHFQVYFERAYAPRFGEVAEGRILQVKLGLRKRTLEANYFEDEEGRGDYFDEAGRSTRKALMKTPLDVTVVTSSYGKRKHPILGYTRMHKGVDFRARTGTPIMAAGDGTVERSSRYGAYGNYIRIRHNSTYKTIYAHLSRYGKGIRKGARVKQGQIIGYAGATGRVNAAHLHYEVMVNGKQKNPLRLKLPTGRTLKDRTLTAFSERRQTLLTDIGRIQASQSLLLAAATETRRDNERHGDPGLPVEQTADR